MLLKHRQPNRLSGYNYSWNGLYFVTICTKDRVSYFGDIVDFEMRLNECGEITKKYWAEIPKHFPLAKLDEWVIMPNHIHGIILIDDTNADTASVGDADLRPLQRTRASNPFPRTTMVLSKIIHGFKSSVTRIINDTQHDFQFQWQRSFHDHIIRDPESLEKIRLYIRNNPAKWHEDRNNPINIK